MASLQLFFVPHTPASTFVRLIGRAVGVSFDLTRVDPSAGDLLTPEFLALNPRHSAPTLIDHGSESPSSRRVVLWESRAIGQYLLERYGGSRWRHLLPPLTTADLLQRAHFTQRVVFDAELQQCLEAVARQLVFPSRRLSREENATRLQSRVARAADCLRVLDMLVARDGERYLGGGRVGLLDYSAVCSVAVCTTVKQLEFGNYLHVLSWLERLRVQIDGYDELVEPCVSAVSKAISRMNNHQSSE